MSPTDHPSGLTVRTADLSRSRPPRWAWEGRIALGSLNLLVGNEGVGKGTLIAYLVGMLTTGRLPGDLRGQPVGVGVLGDEDSFDDVWAPRLHAAGADLSRVVQIERPDGGYVELSEDRSKLAAVARSEGLRVLFLDALLDHLGVGVDDWRAKAVRDALRPARTLARDLDLAFLGAMHPNKRADSFRTLVAGASAFNAVSRSSLLLAAHPDDEDRRVLVRGKGNLVARPQAVEFDIESYTFPANGHNFSVPRASEFVLSDLTVDDLVGPEGVARQHSKAGDAAAIIEALLPRDGGWHPAKAIYEACAEEGIEERTVQRAAERLAVERRRGREFPAPMEWRWAPTPDSPRGGVESVVCVGSVGSARTPRSGDSPDSPDSENARRERVGSAVNARMPVDAHQPLDALTADVDHDWR